MNNHKYYKISFLAVLLSSLFLTACLNESDLNDLVPEKAKQEAPKFKQLLLNKTESCDAYTDYLAKVFTEQLIQPYYYYRCPECDVVALPAAEVGFADDASAPAADKSPDAVSGTNNQEAGVNESDIIKTDQDGNLYVINDNWFVIEDAFPPENINELSRLDLDAQTLSLHLDETNQRAIVVAQSYYPYYTTEPGFAEDALFAPPSEPKFHIFFIDVSDKSSPTISQKLLIDGYYISSRRIEDRLHLTSSHYVNVPASIRDNELVQDIIKRVNEANLTEEEREEIRVNMQTALSGLLKLIDISTLFPQVEKNPDNPETEALLSCESIYHPEVTITQNNLLMLTSIDTNADNRATTGIIANGYITYASQDNFYLAQPSWGWWWTGNDQQQTIIHQFSINGSSPEYLATGTIPGTVHDSFSFSEHNGYLRVTSTETLFLETSPITGNRSTNNRLMILENDGSQELKTVSTIEKFGESETIFSNRFMGDRAFVVTFRQTDPLFAFDLSDPLNPKLMGELHIPGFSDYMQPIDENHLLTIGKSGDNRKIQLQIFDVSDMTSPQLLHKHTPYSDKEGYDWSPANYDHHAFNYFAPAKALAIPFSYNNWREKENFNGILSFNIDLETGITPISQVDHSDFIENQECKVIGFTQSGEEVCAVDSNFWYPVRPTRTAIMTSDENLYLYSLSRLGIKATTLDENADVLGRIRLPVRTN